MCESEVRCQRSEIEITPAMVEAGARRVADLEGFPPAYVAEETFLAMAVAARAMSLQDS